MTILYFTATGNGLYLAKKIGGKLVSIPQAIKEGTYHFSDDKIGIIFPIYGVAVPQYIRVFLKKLQLDSDYIFSIMSYGMFNGGAVNHLQELALENNIRFSYINVIKMVDNYLPGFDMDKQIETEPKKNIDQHLKHMIDDISDRRRFIHKDSFLGKLFTKNRIKAGSYKTGVGLTDQYKVEDTCTKCSTCAKVCPTDNIKVNDAKPEFGAECISCLACTQNCPQNSIRLSGEKSKTRFRHPQVTLKEIIESNR